MYRSVPKEWSLRSFFIFFKKKKEIKMEKLKINDGIITIGRLSLVLTDEQENQLLKLAKEMICESMSFSTTEEKGKKKKETAVISSEKKKEMLDKVRKIYWANPGKRLPIAVIAEQYNVSIKTLTNAIFNWKRISGLLKNKSSELSIYIASNNYEIKESDLMETAKRFNMDPETLKDKVFEIRRISGIDL